MVEKLKRQNTIVNKRTFINSRIQEVKSNFADGLNEILYSLNNSLDETGKAKKSRNYVFYDQYNTKTFMLLLEIDTERYHNTHENHRIQLMDSKGIPSYWMIIDKFTSFDELISGIEQLTLY